MSVLQANLFCQQAFFCLQQSWPDGFAAVERADGTDECVMKVSSDYKRRLIWW